MSEEEVNETTEEETPDAPAAEEAPAAEAPAAEAPAAEDKPEVEAPTHPKEIRKLKRSTHSGEPNAPRTPEERRAEKAAKRAKNAAERRRYRAKQREKKKAAGPREGTPAVDHAGEGGRRERQGIVLSSKADKTITVRIDSARQHRVYGKIVRTSARLYAHDESNEANEGDTVRVIESRPLSAKKRWRLAEVLDRAR
jgi:small subunit ribosomal protein S17